MIIELKKFGNILTSRQLGRESYLAMQPSFATLVENEPIEIDFLNVMSFAPSWGDEFLTPLIRKYGDRVVLKNTDNSSVQATLEFLQDIHGLRYKKA